MHRKLAGLDHGSQFVGQLVPAAVPLRPGEQLLKHGTGQLCHEIPANVVPWTQVWELIAPGITDERVTELRAAWHEGKAYRALHGQHFDDRLHMACCAFFAPVPKDELVQLDIVDLIGATA
jgi:hypothetical protein